MVLFLPASWLSNRQLVFSAGLVEARHDFSSGTLICVSGIGRAEYSTLVKAPALIAVSVPENTVNYASPDIFKTVAAIRWLRVQDKAGNLSSWYPV